MLIRKGFKFRLKTDKFIEAALAKAAGCNRFVWNTALGIQKSCVAGSRDVAARALRGSRWLRFYTV